MIYEDKMNTIRFYKGLKLFDLIDKVVSLNLKKIGYERAQRAGLIITTVYLDNKTINFYKKDKTLKFVKFADDELLNEQEKTKTNYELAFEINQILYVMTGKRMVWFKMILDLLFEVKNDIDTTSNFKKESFTKSSMMSSEEMEEWINNKRRKEEIDKMKEFNKKAKKTKTKTLLEYKGFGKK